MSGQSRSIEVFYVYVNADAALRNELEKHLSQLQRLGLISSWHYRQIVPGTDWTKAINPHLETAALILLLISPDFVSSNYCSGMELKRALQRHQANEARVIPLLLRSAMWKGTSFGHLEALPTDARSVTIWENQEAAFANIAAGIRQALEALARDSGSRITLPSVWNVPYPRNACFTGRDSLLTQLSTALSPGQALVLSQSQATSELGGMGKTQIAVEYGYRHRHDYQAVLWTLAATRASLVSGYMSIAAALNLPEKDAPDQQITIQAVKTWLQSHGSWLLILDHADDLTLLREFVPSVFGGHLLLTTRAQEVGLANRLEVDPLDLDTAALFLLRRGGLVVEKGSLGTASFSDETVAREIGEELAGLPLALELAGACIEEAKCSLRDYQQSYRARRTLLLQQRGGSVAGSAESVATAWSLCYEQVEQRCPAAGDLLRACAFLAPDAIAEEIVMQGAAHLGTRLQSIASNPHLLDEAIGTLSAYGLLRRESTHKMLTLQRGVQAVVRNALQVSMAPLWMGRVLQAVNAVLPAVEQGNWAQWERILFQVQTCIQWIGQGGMHLREGTRILQQAGWYLIQRARYMEAQPLLEQAYAVSEREWGEMDLDTARDAATLGYLAKVQGKYDEAERWYKQALLIRWQKLGAAHPDTTVCLEHLAVMYKKQGKYAKVELLYKQALEISEQKLGANHPDIARILNHLARIYKKQEKYEEAEPLYRRALMIRWQKLGAAHPDTAVSLNNLAALYDCLEKYEEAEPLYRQALEINEQQLGTDHPETATSLNNLAALYDRLEKDGEAERLYKRALRIRWQRLGDDHSSTAASLNNLAVLYKNQEKYAEAEPLFRQALTIYEQDGEHATTQRVRSNYVSLLREMGREAEADALERQGHERELYQNGSSRRLQ